MPQGSLLSSSSAASAGTSVTAHREPTRWRRRWQRQASDNETEHHVNLELQLPEPPSPEAAEAQLVATLLQSWERSLQRPVPESSDDEPAWVQTDFACVHHYREYWIRRIENEWVAAVAESAALRVEVNAWAVTIASVEPTCTDYADRAVLQWAAGVDPPPDLVSQDVYFLQVERGRNAASGAGPIVPALRLTRLGFASCSGNVHEFSVWIPRNCLHMQQRPGTVARLWRAFSDEREWRTGLVPFVRQLQAVTRLGQIHRPLLYALIRPQEHFASGRNVPSNALPGFQTRKQQQQQQQEQERYANIREMNTGGSVKPDFSLGLLNDGQMQAITRIVEARPGSVTLIVGPPGTGKSRTIIGALRRLTGETPAPRLLVCAPSNHAVRLLYEQFRSQSDTTRPVGIAWLQAQSQRQEHANNAPNSNSDGQTGIEWNALVHDVPIRNADVVFATLNSAAGLGFQGTGRMRERPFQYVIVDEASQAVEPDTLIPLILESFCPTNFPHGDRMEPETIAPSRLVLVGDARQLPATVRSRLNQTSGYDKSLFERLSEAAERVHGAALCWLDEQYRMHPSIAAFPSHFFYGDRLRTACQVCERLRGVDSPIELLDMSGDAEHREIRVATSLANPYEAARLVRWLAENQPKLVGSRKDPLTVLLITPYRAQVRFLEEALQEFHLWTPAAAASSQPTRSRQEYRVATVDAAQGAEADLVIFSPVRSARHGVSACITPRALSIGFVADTRRLNVALTRARSQLVVGGDLLTLVRASPVFAAWITFLCERKLVPNPEALWERLCEGLEHPPNERTTLVDTSDPVASGFADASEAAKARKPDVVARQNRRNEAACAPIYPCKICRQASTRISAAVARKQTLGSLQEPRSTRHSPTAGLPPAVASISCAKMKRTQKDARIAAARAEAATARIIHSDDDASSDAGSLPTRGGRAAQLSRRHRTNGGGYATTRPQPVHKGVDRRWRSSSDAIAGTNADHFTKRIRAARPAPSSVPGLTGGSAPSAAALATVFESPWPRERVSAEQQRQLDRVSSVQRFALGGATTTPVTLAVGDRFREPSLHTGSVARNSTAVQRIASRLAERAKDTLENVRRSAVFDKEGSGDAR